MLPLFARWLSPTASMAWLLPTTQTQRHTLHLDRHIPVSDHKLRQLTINSTSHTYGFQQQSSKPS